MFVEVKGFYRDENAKEVNELLEQLIKDLISENEAVVDIVRDMTLDYSERKDKSFWEVVGNPENYQELITLQSRNNTLEYLITELNSILYSDYEEIPLEPEEKEHRMNTEEMSDWLGENVKPLILKGITKRQAVAIELECPAPSILWRIRSVYGKSMNWKKYVEKVIDGIY